MSKDQVSIIMRTADRSRAAEVSVPRSMSAADLVDASKNNWKLPADVDYQIINNRTGTQLLPGQALSPDLVADGDELVVNPMLVAG